MAPVGDGAVHLLRAPQRLVGDLHDHLAAVVRVGDAAQVAEPFETDQHRGDTPRGQAERGSQLAGGGRPLRHEDLHAPEVGAVDAQPLCGELVESVDAGLVGLHLLGQLGLEFVAT